MDRSVFLDFQIIQIKWYSVFILIALLTSSLIVKKETKKKKLDQEEFINILFYGFIIGILGARLYYVLFNLSYYQNLLDTIKIWEGGLAIHGGIISAFLFLYWYTQKKNINLLLLLDCMVVGLIIAQSIGRWGNFFNEEAYGRIVTLSFLKNMHLPSFIIEGMYINGEYREPTFLYESVLSFIGFIILLLFRKKKDLKVGQLTGMYFIWYGIERLIIESFRADSLLLGQIKIAQVVSLIFIGIGIFFYRKNNKKDIKYREEKFN